MGFIVLGVPWGTMSYGHRAPKRKWVQSRRIPNAHLIF